MARRRKNLSNAAVIGLAVTGVVLVPVALAGLGIYAFTRIAKKAKEEIDDDAVESMTRNELDHGTTTGGGTWSSRIWNTGGVPDSAPGWCFSFESTNPNRIAKSPGCTLTYAQARAEVAKLRASVAGINEIGAL